MGSTSVDSLFTKIADGASPYTEIVHQTLEKLWVGCGNDSSKVELMLTATVLINEICSYNNLPSSEVSLEGLKSKEAFRNHIQTGFELHLSQVKENVGVENERINTAKVEILTPNPKISVRPIDLLNTEMEYLCNLCKTLIENYEQVHRHCQNTHPGQKVPILKLVHQMQSQIKSENRPEIIVFECLDCDLDFKTEEELKEHVRAHNQFSVGNGEEEEEEEAEEESKDDGEEEEEGLDDQEQQKQQEQNQQQHKCEQCGKIISTAYALRKHIKSVHEKEAPYECPKCNKKFRHCSSYLRHKIYSHGQGPKPYKCTTCDKAWMYKYLLEEHNRIVHEGNKSAFPCEKCGKGFGRANNLKKHIETVHATSYDFVCDYCGKAFPIKQYLRGHIRDYHSELPSVQELLENSRFKFKGPHDPKTRVPEKKFDCEKCDKKFTHKTHLECHSTNVHDGIKPYCCHLCGKAISSRANLKLHMTRHEENRPKFVCEVCGKEFLNKQTLKEHVVFTHERNKEDKTFVCSACGKKFWFKKELAKHVKLVHHKIYDYKCDVCGRAFGTGTHLKTHKKTVHDKIHEYKCHLCTVEYGHQQSLKKHLETVHSITDYMPPKRKT